MVSGVGTIRRAGVLYLRAWIGERVGVVCRAMYWSYWSYGVMVSTLDFESSDPGSNPGRTSFLRQ